uniref:Bm8097 n=1 Tax=Brugia malayi TaxID=6279 RepID=A0A0H5SDJ4_BRUMA|nr:Bm8097 [Brugia malayi]
MDITASNNLASGTVSEVLLSEGEVVLSRTNENEVFTAGYIRDVTESENDSSTTQMNTSERMWQMLCNDLKHKLITPGQEVDVQKEEFAATQEALVKAEGQVELLQAEVTERNTEIGELKAIIQNLRRKAAEDLEKQKMELLQSINESLAAAEHMYCASQAKVAYLETLTEKMYADNAGLRERLSSALSDLRIARAGAIDSKEFYRLLKKRLITIVEKFKLKAENPQLTWMGEENIHYAVDEFEMAIKIILSDDPHLAPLAERFMVFLEARNAESDMDFKSEMNSETHFVLQKFNNNQTKELCKVVWSIISRLDATEQLETLFEAFDDFRRDIKVIKEERENKLKKAKTEQLKLKTTCAYVDYLSGEHKKLEKQVKNVQSCFEKIEKGFHSTLAMQTIDSAANKTRLKSNENLSAATLCSINGKSANMMKENEQRAKVSTGQETDCQIIQKKGSFISM